MSPSGVLWGQVLDSPAASMPSYTERADSQPGPQVMRDLFRYYVPDGNYSQPLVSPLQAADLAGLPPALILSAEYDVLRDEAEAYAARLQAARCEACDSAAPCHVMHARWQRADAQAACCRVDVTVRRFRTAHVGMVFRHPDTMRDLHFSLALIKACWQHATGLHEHTLSKL